jgi:hypothetical protein
METLTIQNFDAYHHFFFRNFHIHDYQILILLVKISALVVAYRPDYENSFRCKDH